MTKSAMAKRLVRKLRHWEGSKLDMRCAAEILEVCEKAGMLPPSTWVAGPHGNDGYQTKQNKWDKEK